MIFHVDFYPHTTCRFCFLSKSIHFFFYFRTPGKNSTLSLNRMFRDFSGLHPLAQMIIDASLSYWRKDFIIHFADLIAVAFSKMIEKFYDVLSDDTLCRSSAGHEKRKY